MFSRYMVCTARVVRAEVDAAYTLWSVSWIGGMKYCGPPSCAVLVFFQLTSISCAIGTHNMFHVLNFVREMWVQKHPRLRV